MDPDPKQTSEPVRPPSPEKLPTPRRPASPPAPPMEIDVPTYHWLRDRISFRDVTPVAGDGFSASRRFPKIQLLVTSTGVENLLHTDQVMTVLEHYVPRHMSLNSVDAYKAQKEKVEKTRRKLETSRGGKSPYTISDRKKKAHDTIPEDPEARLERRFSVWGKIVKMCEKLGVDTSTLVLPPSEEEDEEPKSPLVRDMTLHNIPPTLPLQSKKAPDLPKWAQLIAEEKNTAALRSFLNVVYDFGFKQRDEVTRKAHKALAEAPVISTYYQLAEKDHSLMERGAGATDFELLNNPNRNRPTPRLQAQSVPLLRHSALADVIPSPVKRSLPPIQEKRVSPSPRNTGMSSTAPTSTGKTAPQLVSTSSQTESPDRHEAGDQTEASKPVASFLGIVLDEMQRSTAEESSETPPGVEDVDKEEVA